MPTYIMFACQNNIRFCVQGACVKHFIETIYLCYFQFNLNFLFNCLNDTFSNLASLAARDTLKKGPRGELYHAVKEGWVTHVCV